MTATLRPGGRAARGLYRCGVSGLTGALGAPAEDREVLHVGLEAEGRAQLAGERCRDRDVRLQHGAAVPADQMHVVVPVGQVVRGRAVPQMRVADQPQLLKQLQRAVDGRDVDAARGTPHLAEDVVGGGVFQGIDGFEHQLALRRQPVAALTQLLLPIGAHHNPDCKDLRTRPYLKKAIPSSGRSLMSFAHARGSTTFFRCADMYGRSSTCGVAFSPTHIRSPLTYPYSRLPPV